MPGALWHHERLDELRVKKAPDDLKQIVVAVDPAVSSSEESDETGIVVIGLDEHDQAYVLADLSGRYAPIDWARKVVEAYQRHQANWVVAETNQGGEMVRDMLRRSSPACRSRWSTPSAASTSAPSRRPPSTSRAGCTTSAAMPPSKTRCAPSPATSTAVRARPTASMPWSGD